MFEHIFADTTSVILLPDNGASTQNFPLVGLRLTWLFFQAHNKYND